MAFEILMSFIIQTQRIFAEILQLLPLLVLSFISQPEATC